MPRPPDRLEKPVIRPYVLTGGRTRPRHELAVHALIQTTGKGRAAASQLLTEREAVCRFCVTARSVAEVASLLEIPLGVARIVIDDLEYEGLVEIAFSAHESAESAEFLNRVLEGLRKL